MEKNTTTTLFGREYCTPPYAARELGVLTSTLRNMLDKEKLAERGIETIPQDVLLSPTNRTYVSMSLVEKLKPIMWKNLLA